MFRSYLVIACIIESLSTAADAASVVLVGPVEARVLRVIDGDSFIAEAHVWPGHSVTVSVRIRGIDAPEIRSKCDAERDAAILARAALTDLIGGELVQISNIGGGKYYGRVLADVATSDGRQLGQAMLSAAFARPYFGGKRISLCD